MKKRQLAITAAAVVLVVGVVAGRERPALELVQARAPQAAARADDGIDLEKLRRGETALPSNDPFAKKDFNPQPRAAAAPAAAPPPPAKPVVPPLPFQYAGKWTEGGKTEVFVLLGAELLSVAAGQTHGDYRVEQVTDAGISFTYLPLKTRQTLDLQ